MKIAGAPISWGVCEVPGWGYQLPPHRVLAEMRDVDLSATELGPEGFLPSDPGELTTLLDSYGLHCVATFAPVLLHEVQHDPIADIAGPLDALVACGAKVLVLAAATGADGYDARPTLDDGQWATLLANLDRLAETAADRGVLAVLHPHVGTMVETRDDVDRVLDGLGYPTVPRHRPPADRRDRSAAAGPFGAHAHRACPPQGCRRGTGGPGAGR